MINEVRTQYVFGTGIESTPSFRLENDEIKSGADNLEDTGHNNFFREDLKAMQTDGISIIRYPVPNHYIENTTGNYDWEWMDSKIEALQEAGVNPIFDFYHHTSFKPDVLPKGLRDPMFPHRLEEFSLHFLRRYKTQMKQFNITLVNEPYLTTQFCHNYGIWYPYESSEQLFLDSALIAGRAICQATESIKKEFPETKFYHLDT